MCGIKLLVGLGNPGAKYAATRHNAGFQCIDELARREHATWSVDSKLFGQRAQIHIAGQSIWLLKPATFMNLSGKSVQAALQFFKLASEQALLIHDELDLPPGTARLKFDGGHGGQNGLRDTIRALGHSRFHRLRLGIGHPGHKDRVLAWVLGQPSATEAILTARATDAALAVLPLLVTGKFERAMHALHSKPQ